VPAADQHAGTEHDEKRGQHQRSCAAIDQRINQSLTIRVLANDTFDDRTNNRRTRIVTGRSFERVADGRNAAWVTKEGDIERPVFNLYLR